MCFLYVFGFGLARMRKKTAVIVNESGLLIKELEKPESWEEEKESSRVK